MKHASLIITLMSFMAFSLFIDAHRNHNAQLEAMKYERQATVHEIAVKLRDQGYKVSFRITEDGELAMVYPGNKKKIRADRKYDREMNKIYGGR